MKNNKDVWGQAKEIVNNKEYYNLPDFSKMTKKEYDNYWKRKALVYHPKKGCLVKEGW